jgi:multidrug efflux pump
MRFTDIFIEKPVLASVVSLFILVLGLRAMGSLPILQYPFTENAVVTVTTTYTGANPEIVAGFISTPMENSIAQANGIDYMTSQSTQNTSTITIYLKLNYDVQQAVSDINTKVNAVINQLPSASQQPVITYQIGETIDAMYIGFYSDVLKKNQISDYLLRVVQPKLQTIDGIQQAQILGNQTFAMRIWLDPVKLAGFNLTPAAVAQALANNDSISATGRTDGNMFIVNLTASTNTVNIDQFKKLVISARNGAIVRIGDVATVDMGATSYDQSVSFNGQNAVYIGILVAPAANLLTVIKSVKQALPDIIRQLPQGLNASIAYDSSEFVNSSIYEVIMSLFEALTIVTVVIFVFLGSIRSVIIPLLAIPLSLIGAFFIMLSLNYSINLLTLLALVLAIGLVVDDAIIVVENVQRHIEDGKSPLEASYIGARELASPIIAISVVLIAVYVPIGFMGGLTGALFTEFAFTLAGAVGISAVIALTLSPMMCSKFLKPMDQSRNRFIEFVDHHFERLMHAYQRSLSGVLDYLVVVMIFAAIILTSIYFLYVTSQTELAPTEDQGIIIAQLTGPGNASLQQTHLYAKEVSDIYMSFPETMHVFELDGVNGLNTAIIGMALKPWEQRTRTSNQLQPILQNKLKKLTGVISAVFQLPPLPGSQGVPIQFVTQTTDPYDRLNTVNQEVLKRARATGLFVYLDTDLKLDQAQSSVIIDRDKAAQFGLTMQDIGNTLSAALSQNYINYFDFDGRSYQVIPQMVRDSRQNATQLENYYVNSSSTNTPNVSTANSTSTNTPTPINLPLSTFAKIKTTVVPESINHFQQLNSATLSAVPFPGVTMGQALATLQDITKEVLPQGYTVDYAGPSRQFEQESTALVVTFFFALIIIFLSLAALFESFRDPFTVLISVPMSICGAMIFISLGVGGASLNIYTEVGLVTLIGLISKHGILIVQFANDLQAEGKNKREAIESAATIRLRPILMTTAAMVLGVLPLIFASGAGAVSRFDIGLVIATGLSFGTLFTLFVVPSMYMILAEDHAHKPVPGIEPEDNLAAPV